MEVPRPFPDALLVSGEGLRQLSHEDFIALHGLLEGLNLTLTQAAEVTPGQPNPHVISYLPLPVAVESSKLGSFSFNFKAYRSWAENFGDLIAPSTQTRLYQAFVEEARRSSSVFLRQLSDNRFTVFTESWQDLQTKLGRVPGIGDMLFLDFCGFVYDSLRLPIKPDIYANMPRQERIKSNPFVARSASGTKYQTA